MKKTEMSAVQGPAAYRRSVVFLAAAAVVLAASGAGVKVSERFGFDPEDSTRFLQAALDSDEKEIILDKRDKPWISKPLICTKGKTIRIEDGVWLIAKRGEFHGHTDSLMLFKKCRNAKVIGAGPGRCGLKMWRDDYADTNMYRHSEHRMGISLRSCENVLIEGVTVCETGGDGLYISNSGRNTSPCRDITVRNCVFDRNYRQGVSVISVAGLLMENVVMSNTKGTPPMSGIDFEPNGDGEIISDIVMRDCLTEGNSGGGYMIVPNYFDSESAKVSITLENCRSVDDKSSGFIYLSSFRRRPGYDAEIPYRECDIYLRNCSFVRSGKHGVTFYTRPLSSGLFRMENCLIEDSGTDHPDVSDVAFSVTGHEGFEPFTVDFKGLRIRRKKAREWLDVGEMKPPYKGAPTQFRGDVTVETDGRKTVHTLDAAWRTKNTPFTPCASKPPVLRVKPDMSAVEITDADPGKRIEFAPVFVHTARKARFTPFYALYARKGQAVEIDCLTFASGKKKPIGVLEVGRYGDPRSNVCRKRYKREKTALRFTAPETGFYSLRISTSYGIVGVTAANVPIAIDATRGSVGVIGIKKPFKGYSGGRLYFDVPAGTPAFTAAYYGMGPEGLGARILAPDGVVAHDFGSVRKFRYARVDDPKSGVWSFELDPPTLHGRESHMISLNGVNGWYFLSRDKMWR